LVIGDAEMRCTRARRGRSTQSLLIAAVLTSCASHSVDVGTIPTGRPIAIPLSDPFPAPNLAWVYVVTASSSTPEWIPEQIALSLDDGQSPPYRWGDWRYGTDRGLQIAYLSVEQDEISLSEPHGYGLLDLALAPRPVVNPGRTGVVRATQQVATTEDLRRDRHRMAGDAGWFLYRGDATRETINHGQCRVAVPAGRFDGAWYSTSRFAPESAPSDSEGWECDAWWVDRVGFVKIHWKGPANRSVVLELVEIRRK
jgi:hypothetical protein